LNHGDDHNMCVKIWDLALFSEVCLKMGFNPQ
jgi:hypothetical protein